MKKFLSAVAIAGLAMAALTTPSFAGGHHGGGHRRYQTVTEAVTLAPAICETADCNFIGEHRHDNGSLVTHYYGDGHDFHDEYDCYYGGGYCYNTNGNYACHAGRANY